MAHAAAIKDKGDGRGSKSKGRGKGSEVSAVAQLSAKVDKLMAAIEKDSVWPKLGGGTSGGGPRPWPASAPPRTASEERGPDAMETD
eukprot:3223946-Pyramimonas_sp.AAC.1